jgi:dUTPase
VQTDIQIEVPEGCYGRVAPRSGLAVKNFIDVGGKSIKKISQINKIQTISGLIPSHSRCYR